MTAKYNAKDSSVTIKLSWTEIRQVVSGYGFELIRDLVKKVVKI